MGKEVSEMYFHVVVTKSNIEGLYFILEEMTL